MELTLWEKDVLKEFYERIMEMQNLGASMNVVDAMLDTKETIYLSEDEDLSESPNEVSDTEVDDLALRFMWGILRNPQVNVTWPLDERTRTLKEKLKGLEEDDEED